MKAGRNSIALGMILLALGCWGCWKQKPAQWADQGCRFFGQGQYAEALHAFLQGIEQSPDHAALLYNAGCARLALGDVSRAINDFERAAVFAKEPALRARCHRNLGVAWFAEGQRRESRGADPREAERYYTQSLENFREALRWNPSDPHTARDLEIVKTVLFQVRSGAATAASTEHSFPSVKPETHDEKAAEGVPKPRTFESSADPAAQTGAEQAVSAPDAGARSLPRLAQEAPTPAAQEGREVSSDAKPSGFSSETPLGASTPAFDEFTDRRGLSAQATPDEVLRHEEHWKKSRRGQWPVQVELMKPEW